MTERRMLTADEIINLQKDKRESYYKMMEIMDKMKKPKRINVFPDYSSSGLWDPETGHMINEEDVESSVPESLMIALYYWHGYWEQITDHTKEIYVSDAFHVDGERIVQLMNDSQTDFIFNYKRFD
jgi:hypothetical protein